MYVEWVLTCTSGFQVEVVNPLPVLAEGVVGDVGRVFEGIAFLLAAKGYKVKLEGEK